TKKRTYQGGGEILFRAAASTGALYQTEVYVAVGEVAGLEPGVYHFCPGDFALRRLRGGDVRAALAESAADDSFRRRSATIMLTALYWRDTAADVRAWRSRASSSTPPTPPSSAKLLMLTPPRARAGRGLGETIQRRGSTRQFGHAPLSGEELGTTLWAAARPFEADVPPGLVDLYLIVNAVEGISP